MKYFINDISFIKDNTTIGNNVLDKDIKPIIRATVDKYIKPIMDCLYEEFLQKYNTPGSTWSNEEKAVLEVVQLLLAWAVAYEATIAITRPIRGKGVQSNNGEYSESVTDETMFAVTKRQLSFKDTYERELIDKMCKLNVHCKCSCGNKVRKVKNMFFV